MKNLKVKRKKKKEPVRNKSSSEAVLEADLGGLSGRDRGKIDMSGQEKIAVNQETGARGGIGGGGDGGQSGTFSRENGGFHFLGFGDSFAETPRLAQHSHCRVLPFPSLPLPSLLGVKVLS